MGRHSEAVEKVASMITGTVKEEAMQVLYISE